MVEFRKTINYQDRNRVLIDSLRRISFSNKARLPMFHPSPNSATEWGHRLQLTSLCKAFRIQTIKLIVMRTQGWWLHGRDNVGAKCKSLLFWLQYCTLPCVQQLVTLWPLSYWGFVPLLWSLMTSSSFSFTGFQSSVWEGGKVPTLSLSGWCPPPKPGFLWRVSRSPHPPTHHLIGIQKDIAFKRLKKF